MRDYGSGGKYWNVGLNEPERLSATARQLSRIQRLTGDDMRGQGLTRGKAREIIDQAIAARKERRDGLNDMTSKVFAALVARATNAANEAGAKWETENSKPQFAIFDPETGERVGVHGRIGHAWICWPAKHSKFRKWLDTNLFDGQRKEIRLDHHFAERPELDLQIACLRAAFEVLNQSGNIEGLRIYALTDEQAEAA